MEIVPAWRKRYIQGRTKLCIQFIPVEYVKEIIIPCPIPLQERLRKQVLCAEVEQRLFQSLNTIDGKLLSTFGLLQMPTVTGVWAGIAYQDWSKGQHWNMRKWSWRILPSPIRHPQTSQLPGWSPPPSAGRHRPPGPGSQEICAGTRTARLHVRQRGRHRGGRAGREAARAAGATRGRPLRGAVDGLGRQHPRPARPRPADPASVPHPFLADSRPRPRDGAENPGISRSLCRQVRRVAAARSAVPSPALPSPRPRWREAAANSDPPRAGENQPGAGPPPLPAAVGPPRPGGRAGRAQTTEAHSLPHRGPCS